MDVAFGVVVVAVVVAVVDIIVIVVNRCRSFGEIGDRHPGYNHLYY